MYIDIFFIIKILGPQNFLLSYLFMLVHLKFIMPMQNAYFMDLEQLMHSWQLAEIIIKLCNIYAALYNQYVSVKPNTYQAI